jgi:tetratricopeptide (TPR) repeat protein
LRKDAIREAFDADQWRIARELIDAGLEMNPADPELLAQGGFAALAAMQYRQAAEMLQAAIVLGVQESDVHYDLGLALFMQGRHSAALAALTPAKSHPHVLLLRARCWHHLERRDEAEIACRECLVAQPADADANGLLALLLYEGGQGEAARANIEAALASDPRQREGLLAEASIQADARNYDAARKAFDTLLQAHPQCGRGWLGSALVELAFMNLDAALSQIERAALHMPGHIGTWHVLGWIEILRGKPVAAEVAFERALAIDRTFAETHGGLAVVAVMQGRTDEARDSIKRALRLNPQAMSPKYAQMLLLRDSGQQEAADEMLDSVMARRVVGRDQQYRELVVAQMRLLQTRAAGNPTGMVYH